MRICFLDFDGIFTATRKTLLLGKQFDEDAVRLINMLVSKYDYKIVVTSTWRLNEKYLSLVTYLKLMGFDSKNLFHSDLTTKSLSSVRGDEIEEWLSRHPHVTEYVIIDDDCDMLNHQFSHLIHVDFREGFCMRNYLQFASRHDSKYTNETYQFQELSNILPE